MVDEKPRGQGPPRLHPEREHQDARGARIPFGPAAGRPLDADRVDELDDPDIRPGPRTIRDLPARIAKLGDLFAAAQTDLQELPPV